MAPEKTKAQKSLPPKPSTLSEEQWVLAHNTSKLLELLAAPEGRGHSARSKAGEKPIASKPSAALWLSQLLESSVTAAEEAYKSGAVDVCAKLINTHSKDHALLPCVLIVLARLADPEAGPQTSQTRESILSCRPAIVPALLSQLEQSYAHEHSTAVANEATPCLNSLSTVAAALHLLYTLVLASDTRLRVAKLLVVWNMKPLIAALVPPISLPLEGGRNAAADAAATLEVLCTPATAHPAAQNAEGSTKGGKKPAKDKDNSKDPAAQPTAATGDPINPSLTAALQQAVLEADGMVGLIKLCAAAGAPPIARTAAAAALQQLMSSHGLEDDVKAVFLDVGGLSAMVKLMVATQLPLKSRAAAAGCIWHYLAPQPAASATAAQNSKVEPAASRTATVVSAAHHTAAAAAADDFFFSVGPAATAASDLGLSCTFGRPITSHEAQANVIAAARILRKQQHDQAMLAAPCSTKVSSNGGYSSNGGTNSVSSSLSGGSAQSARQSMAAAVAAMSSQPPAGADAVALYQAALAVWNEAAQAGLSARAEQVIQSGCIPALLLLCCGLEGSPAGLEAAAMAAAAEAEARQCSSAAQAQVPDTAAAVATGGASSLDNTCVVIVNSSSSGSNHTDVQACRRKTLNSATAKADHTARGLGAIAEPTHGEEGADEADDDSQQTATDVLNTDDDGSNAADSAAAMTPVRGSTGKKAKKKAGKKGSTNLPQEMQDAHVHASAALKLLALSGDGGRAALQDAGAKAVLMPLLGGQTDVARWNARQVLMSMALVSSNSKPAARSTGSLGLMKPSSSSNLKAQAVQASANAAAAGVGVAARTGIDGRSGPPWLLAAEPVIGPKYISMDNIPASHYQRSAPISQVPLPVLPTIPGRARIPEGGCGTTAGSSVGAGGTMGPGASRPSSQTRRLSVSNLAGQISASRMNSAHNNSSASTIGGDGLGMCAEGSFAGSTRACTMILGKGMRGSLLATATGAASGIGATAVTGPHATVMGPGQGQPAA